MDIPVSLHWSQVCSLLGCGVSPLGESHSTGGPNNALGAGSWLSHQKMGMEASKMVVWDNTISWDKRIEMGYPSEIKHG